MKHGRHVTSIETRTERTEDRPASWTNQENQTRELKLREERVKLRLIEVMEDMWLEAAKEGENQKNMKRAIASMGKEMATKLAQINNHIAKTWKDVAEGMASIDQDRRDRDQYSRNKSKETNRTSSTYCG